MLTEKSTTYLLITALRVIIILVIIFLIAQKKDKYTIDGDIFPKQIWNCYNIFLVFVPYITLIYINALVTVYQIIPPFVMGVLNIPIFFILTFSILYAILKSKYALSLSVLGFVKKNAGYYIIYGLKIFFLVLSIISILTYFFDDSNSFSPSEFITILSLKQSIIIFFLYIFVGPAAEEAVFRGFMYVPIKRKIGGKNSALLISFIEFLTHFQYGLYDFFGIFIRGLISFYIYEKSRSLIPAILFHTLWNSGVAITKNIYPFLRQSNIVETQTDYFFYIGILSLVGLIILTAVSRFKAFKKIRVKS
jgi:membrane protease YdiL (CAAX protease family)